MSKDFVRKPPRGYRWPDATPGNLIALKHGANSERIIAERAELVHQELLAVAPHLDHDQFLPAVNRYLQAASREALLHTYITEKSEVDGPGAVSSRTWEQATAAARLAAKLGSDLGLDPIGHARIRALSVSAAATEETLADLAERGKGMRARRQEAIDAAAADDDEAS